MKFNSIRTRITIVLIILCIIVILFLGAIWYYTTRDNIREAAFTITQQDSNLVALYVDQYLGNISSNLMIVAGQNNTVQYVQAREIEHLRSIAYNLLAATPSASLVAFSDKNGEIIYVSRPTSITNIRMYEWFNGTKARNQSYVSPLFYSYTMIRNVVAITAPILKEGEFVGIIDIVFEPDDLQKNILKQRIDPAYSIIVVDNNGVVITDTDMASSNRTLDLSSYEAFQNVLKGKTGVSEYAYTWDNKTRIIAYSPIGTYGWGAIVSLPVSDAYRPLYLKMKWIVLTLTTLAGLSILTGFYVSKYLSDPIVNLTGSILQVSRGNMDVRADTSRGDEIGDLARGFNNMIEELNKRDVKINKEKERSELFIDLMSHDIGNYNQAIMGFIELAMQNEKDPEIKKMLEDSLSSINKSNTLIQNVKILRELDSSSNMPVKTDLDKVIGEALQAELLGTDKKVNIDYNPGKDRYIQALPVISMVFRNIFNNSIKYSNDPVFISIHIGREADCYAVSVTDQGHGISDDVKERLFHRIEKDRLTFKGKGLGMYLSKIVVDRTGGTILVTDRIVGDHTRGTKFIIRLPVWN